MEFEGLNWFQGKWSDCWLGQSITLLELCSIMVVNEVWSHELQNKQLSLQTDNMALVSVLQKRTSKESLVVQLIRRLALCCLQSSLVLSARHMPGVENSSRFQMERFLAVCPYTTAYLSQTH